MKHFVLFLKRSVLFLLCLFSSMSLSAQIGDNPAPPRFDFGLDKYGNEHPPQDLVLGDTVNIRARMFINPSYAHTSFTVGNGNKTLDDKYIVIHNLGEFSFSGFLYGTKAPYSDRKSKDYTLNASKFRITKKQLSGENHLLLHARIDADDYLWFKDNVEIAKGNQNLEITETGNYSAKALKDGIWYESTNKEVDKYKFKTYVDESGIPFIQIRVGDTLNVSKYAYSYPRGLPISFSALHSHKLYVIQDTLLIAKAITVGSNLDYVTASILETDNYSSSSNQIRVLIEKGYSNISFKKLPTLVQGDTINLNEYAEVRPSFVKPTYVVNYDHKIVQDSLLIIDSFNQVRLSAIIPNTIDYSGSSKDVTIDVSIWSRPKKSSISFKEFPRIEVGDTLNLRNYIIAKPTGVVPIFFSGRLLEQDSDIKIVEGSLLIAKNAGRFTVTATIPNTPDLIIGSKAIANGTFETKLNKQSSIEFTPLPNIAVGDTINLQNYITFSPAEAQVKFEILSGQGTIQDSLLIAGEFGNLSIRATLIGTDEYDEKIAHTHTSAETFSVLINSIDENRVNLHATLEGEHYYWFHENRFIGAGKQDREVILENGDYFVDVYKNGRWYRSNIVNNVIPEHFDLVKTKNSDDTFTLSSSIVGSHYYWFRNDRFNPNQKENQITISESGSYFLDVYIEGRGWIRSNYLDLDVFANEETPNARNITVYPSTVDQQLMITLDNAEVDVKIYNYYGLEIYNNHHSGLETLEINPSLWAVGHYDIYITFDNAAPKHFKVYKR